MRRSLFLAACLLTIPVVAPTAHAAPTDAHHARGTENVFWFLHISDVHIGSPLYVNYEPNARLIFDKVIPTVQPWFVLVSGDLVDAAKNYIPTAGQVQAEWDLYKSLYEGAGMTPDFYFELPGNHDGYDDEGFTHFLANSLLGRTHHRLFTTWSVEIPAGKYLFFGFNSAGNGSGPFFEKPYFHTEEIEEFEQILQSQPSTRLTILTGHHPLSVKGGDQVVESLQSVGGGYYLHGHNHEYEEYMAGKNDIVVNQIHSLAQGKTNNIGIVAVDHDGLVYRATGTQKPWPHVVITAPMNVVLRDQKNKKDVPNPFAYDICKDRTDNPIRALVFSPEAPSEVTAQVGGAPPGLMTPSVSSGNLWTVEVDTTGLTAGIHDVTVSAKVGAEVAVHKIRAKFVDGPCDVLPEDPPPEEKPDAGVDAQPEEGGLEGGSEGGAGGEAGAGGMTGGTGGSGGTSGYGGMPGVGGTNLDAGVDPGADGSGDQAAEGGCSCVQAGRSHGSWGVWLLMGLGWLGVRRRR